jgi:hypothetical protein
MHALSFVHGMRAVVCFLDVRWRWQKGLLVRIRWSRGRVRRYCWVKLFYSSETLAVVGLRWVCFLDVFCRDKWSAWLGAASTDREELT